VLQDASTSTLAQLRLISGQRLPRLLLVGGPLSDVFTVFLSGARHLIQATDGCVIVQGALNGAFTQGIGGLRQLLHVVAQLTILATGILSVLPVAAASEGRHSDDQPQQQVGGNLHRHTAVPGQPAAM